MDYKTKGNYYLIIRIFSLMAAIAVMLAGMSSCSNIEVETIDIDVREIEITFFSFWEGNVEYKIDFIEKKAWVYSDSFPRDPSAPNEGFYFWKTLGEEKINSFVRQFMDNEVEKWEGEYELPDNIAVADGLRWSFTQVWKGERTIKAWGYEAFPENWDEIGNSFEKLLGLNVLYEAAPKPKFKFFKYPFY